MKILLVLCVGLCAIYANPIPEPQAIDMLRIPFGEGDKELDILTLADQDGKINERNKRTIGMLRELFPTLSQVATEDGEMDPNAFNEELTRVIRDLASQQTNAIDETKDDASSQGLSSSGVASSTSDQQVAETQSAAQSSSSALDELSLDDNDESIDDENRNKRFLNFGFGASSGTGGAAASGGSGNFLFDIIRRTADRAARAAGTVYRIVAGTEPLGGITETKLIGSKTSSVNSQREDSTNDTTNDGLNPVLVGGSSGTEQTDEQANTADAAGAVKTDGYTEGIPGPVTRLFVLANRGLSNLIQDLILRVAQTSERVVNFKARLITSLI